MKFSSYLSSTCKGFLLSSQFITFQQSRNRFHPFAQDHMSYLKGNERERGEDVGKERMLVREGM